MLPNPSPMKLKTVNRSSLHLSLILTFNINNLPAPKILPIKCKLKTKCVNNLLYILSDHTSPLRPYYSKCGPQI